MTKSQRVVVSFALAAIGVAFLMVGVLSFFYYSVDIFLALSLSELAFMAMGLKELVDEDRHRELKTTKPKQHVHSMYG